MNIGNIIIIIWIILIIMELILLKIYDKYSYKKRYNEYLEMIIEINMVIRPIVLIIGVFLSFFGI
jgi:hypothetical protein